MEKVYVGKITSFHGIKGELRIISELEQASTALKVGNEIIIEGETHIIKSYRKHKHYDMITIDDYQNINEVLYLKNKRVYIDRKYLEDIEFLDQDLIGMKVIIKGEEKGVIKEIRKISSQKKLFVVEYKEKDVLVPYEFLKEVNKEEKKIYLDSIEGLGL